MSLARDRFKRVRAPHTRFELHSAFLVGLVQAGADLVFSGVACLTGSQKQYGRVDAQCGALLLPSTRYFRREHLAPVGIT